MKYCYSFSASVGPALGIVAASYSGCDKMLAVASFTIGMGLMGTFVPSLKVNALDLSPNYAGTLMAIVGTIGCLSGVIAPYIVGIMVPNVCYTVLYLFNRIGLKIKLFFFI